MISSKKNTSTIHNWVIYKITNPEGAVYVGKTKDFKGRVSNYRNLSKSVVRQKLIYNSLCKYGYENHKIDVLEQFDSTLSYANGKEIFWIRSYMSNLRKWRDHNGLNLTNGGDGLVGVKFPNRVSPFKGKKLSEESKKKISEYNKLNPVKPMLGKKHLDESKEKISKSKKGKPSHFKGSKKSALDVLINRISHIGIPSKNKGKLIWSEEDKKRIGASKIGNKYLLGYKMNDSQKLSMRLAKIKKCKPILQFDLDGNFIAEYLSSREAASKTGMARKSIIDILTGETINPKKYIFKYKC